MMEMTIYITIPAFDGFNMCSLYRRVCAYDRSSAYHRRGCFIKRNIRKSNITTETLLELVMCL
jgi:hypothetical protein